MRTFLSGLFSIVVLFMANESFAQPGGANITASDLEGEWVIYNYFCDGPLPAQEMRLEAVGPKLVATKTRGDPCVPAGHRTWEGTLSGSTINGRQYVSSGPNTSIFTNPLTLTVVDINTITSTSGNFRRNGEAVAEEVPAELGKVEVTVTNARTGDPVSYETVGVFSASGGQTAGSAFLSRRDRGVVLFDGIEPGEYRVEIEDRRWADASRTATATVEGGRTTKVEIKLDIDQVEIIGRFRAFNNANRYENLKDLEVRVVFSDGHIVTTDTDDEGKYTVTYDAAPDTFRVYGKLASNDGEIAIHSRKGFGGAVIEVSSRPLVIDRPVESGAMYLRTGSGRLNRALSSDMKEAIEHGGSFYLRIHAAKTFTRERLNLRLNHQLPVTATLWSDKTTGAYYLRSDATMEISGNGKKSMRTDGNSPDNREYHEFGHHVMADSAIGGENTYAGRVAGEKNHDGIKNGRSVDSVTEGFAEFFALWVKGSSVYKWPSATDLENNLQNMRRKKLDASGNVVRDARGRVQWESVMREEFQIAALLWDILDSNQDANDYIDLTDRQMWSVINRVTIKDVASIYREVRGPLRNRRSVPGSVLDDVDTLFVAHRFFSDTNGNGAWNPGEQIGVADFYRKSGATQIRQQIPPLENSDIEIQSPPGLPEIRQVRLSIQYVGGTRTELGTSDLNEGRLTIEVPDNAEYLEILPVMAGHTPQPIRITPDQYFEALAEADLSNSPLMLRFEVSTQPVALSAPTDPTIGRDADGLWLGWTGSGPQYVLVEGAVRAPETLTDGAELYRGTNQFYQIVDIIDYEVPRFFSVFAVDPAGNASEPLSILWVPETDDPKGMSLWLKIILGLFAIALIWFAFARRRKEQ